MVVTPPSGTRVEHKEVCMGKDLACALKVFSKISTKTVVHDPISGKMVFDIKKEYLYYLNRKKNIDYTIMVERQSII